jgi:hypothetical protein
MIKLLLTVPLRVEAVAVRQRVEPTYMMVVTVVHITITIQMDVMVLIQLLKNSIHQTVDAEAEATFVTSITETEVANGAV